MGGQGPGLPLGGARGAQMAGCLGCRRGRLLTPSSQESCQTCCPPPPLPGCWGRGWGGLPLLPPPGHLFHGRSSSTQHRGSTGRRLGTSGDLLPGRNRGVGDPRRIRRGRHPESWEIWILG